MKSDEFELAEKTVLGCLFMNADHCLPLAVGAGVATDWFTDDVRALVWEACQSLWVDRAPIDTTSVFVRARQIAATPKHPRSGVVVLPSDIEGYVECAPTSGEFEYYMDLLRKSVMERRVKKAGARFSESLEDGADVDFALQSFITQLAKIGGMSAASKEIDVGAVLEKIREEYKAAYQKRVIEGDLEYTPGIPLPWKVPNIASQGVQEGLYYLGARPSVGKTAFALNLVRFWCERGVKVAFNSLDMAIKPMLKRPVGELSRVSLTKASFGTVTHEQLAAIDDAIDGVTNEDGTVAKVGVKSWPMKLVRERDVEQFRSWCQAAHSAGRLDIVIVDFVQLMTTRARYANDNEKLEHISGVLKSIALDLDIPVIALSQLNRACEDDGGRVPTASDLRGSGALEQDATAVWILHGDRDVVKTWNDSPATKPLGLTPGKRDVEFKGIKPVRFIIAKNQNGQAGPETWFPFVFFAKYCFFMLGDIEATPLEITTGVGATKKTTKDYSPQYAKVTHDWRCDPFERTLRQNGALIGFDLQRDTFLMG